MDILINHLGYTAQGPKKAVIRISGCGYANSRINVYITAADNTNDIRYRCSAVYTGQVDAWKDWLFWTVDFSKLGQAGTFRILCSLEGTPGTVSALSEPFELVNEPLIYRTLPAILAYLKSQRCTGANNDADRSLPFYGERSDRVDVHGGWYDAAGDTGKYLSHLSYAKYFNPQQTPLVVWSLLECLSKIQAAGIMKEYRQDMVEEAVYGAEFLNRMQDTEGWFYLGIFDTWSKDPGQRVICAFTGIEGTKSDMYKAGFRMGGGMTIAALARLYAMRKGLPAVADFDKFLKTAESGFRHLWEHNAEYAEDGEENIIDDYCALLAAAELWHGTKNKFYLEAARLRADRLIYRISEDENYHGWFAADNEQERPYYHASDAGLPAASLIIYARYEQDAHRAEKALTAAAAHFDFILSITGETANPFGYPRQYVRPVETGHKDNSFTYGKKRSVFFMPHENETGYWWQGENARIASLAAAALMLRDTRCVQSGQTDPLAEFAAAQTDWILGLNPYDACMLHGFGRNNPEYEAEYPNAFGGICNGITAGFFNEADIDFLPAGISAYGDQRWRWSEQWLPHAAWFITAISQEVR